MSLGQHLAFLPTVSGKAFCHESFKKGQNDEIGIGEITEVGLDWTGLNWIQATDSILFC